MEPNEVTPNPGHIQIMFSQRALAQIFCVNLVAMSMFVLIVVAATKLDKKLKEEK